jgi:hypothetical protein
MHPRVVELRIRIPPDPTILHLPVAILLGRACRIPAQSGRHVG